MEFVKYAKLVVILNQFWVIAVSFPYHIEFGRYLSISMIFPSKNHRNCPSSIKVVLYTHSCPIPIIKYHFSLCIRTFGNTSMNPVDVCLLCVQAK